MVEFFGAHEFALLKPDALKPLSTLDKCPNKSVRDRGLSRFHPVGLALLLCLSRTFPRTLSRPFRPFYAFPVLVYLCTGVIYTTNYCTSYCIPGIRVRSICLWLPDILPVPKYILRTRYLGMLVKYYFLYLVVLTCVSQCLCSVE